MKKLITLTTLIISQSLFAGNEKGNGGDTCEIKLQSQNEKIKSMLINNEIKNLKMPKGLSFLEYKKRMIEEANKVIFSCSKKTIKLGSTEKTCLNYKDNQNQSRIECNLDRFLSITKSEQFKLVHHELAGLANLESNLGDERSNYFITNQLPLNWAINYSFMANNSIKNDDGSCSPSSLHLLQTEDVLIIQDVINGTFVFKLSADEVKKFENLGSRKIGDIVRFTTNKDGYTFTFNGEGCGSSKCESLEIVYPNDVKVELKSSESFLDKIDCE